MSRVGKKPIVIPNNVKVNIEEGHRVEIEGPKGKLEYAVPENFGVEIKDGKIFITRPSEEKKDRALHGLIRSLINNMVKGTTEGYSKELEIQGVGYRAQVQSKELNIQLQFTHPVVMPIPEGIVIETPKPTTIIVKGIDKEKVGQVAAKIRAYFPPEPYKGKGIRYVGEYVRHKEGKTAA